MTKFDSHSWEYSWQTGNRREIFQPDNQGHLQNIKANIILKVVLPKKPPKIKDADSDQASSRENMEDRGTC